MLVIRHVTVRKICTKALTQQRIKSAQVDVDHVDHPSAQHLGQLPCGLPVHHGVFCYTTVHHGTSDWLTAMFVLHHCAPLDFRAGIGSLRRCANRLVATVSLMYRPPPSEQIKTATEGPTQGGALCLCHTQH